MKSSFKDYLVNEAKSLNYNPEFVFANKQVFDADFAVHPNSSEAQKVVSKIQQPKIDALAQKLDITWTMLFANSHEQHDRWRGTSRTVWSYILVGNDPDGNEVAYYKYEAGPGSGQSHVYGNRKNKTKLTWLLAARPAQAKEALGFTKHAPGGAIPTEEDELKKFLKRKFRKSNFVEDNQGRFRLVIPTGKQRWSNSQDGLSFIFKKWGKKTKVNYEYLEGIKQVRKGYNTNTHSWGSSEHPIGTFDDITPMLKALRKRIKRTY